MVGHIILQRVRNWYYLHCPKWLFAVTILVLYLAAILIIALSIRNSYEYTLASSRVYTIFMIIMFQIGTFMYVPDLLTKKGTIVSKTLTLAIIMIFIMMEMFALQHYQIKFMMGL